MRHYARVMSILTHFESFLLFPLKLIGFALLQNPYIPIFIIHIQNHGGISCEWCHDPVSQMCSKISYVCQTYLCEGLINHFPWKSLTIRICCTYSRDNNGENWKSLSEIIMKIQQFKVECLGASKMRHTCVMRTNGASNQYKTF